MPLRLYWAVCCLLNLLCLFKKLFYFWGAGWCSGVTSSSAPVLRNYSWQYSEDHMRCQGSNSIGCVWRQTPFTDKHVLYYCFHPLCYCYCLLSLIGLYAPFSLPSCCTSTGLSLLKNLQVLWLCNVAACSWSSRICRAGTVLDLPLPKGYLDTSV